MMMINPTTRPSLTAKGDQRAELAQAAKAFEAIFVRQIMAAARKTDFAGEDNLFGGQAMETFRQMQDERFAQIAADSGMLGIGRMIEAQLAGQMAAVAPPAPQPLKEA